MLAVATGAPNSPVVGSVELSPLQPNATQHGLLGFQDRIDDFSRDLSGEAKRMA